VLFVDQPRGVAAHDGTRFVRERQPGDTVSVELVREGRPLTLSVVLASD